MAKKKNFDIHVYLSDLADNMGKKHAQKVHSQLSGDDPGLKYLKIPIIGGPMYLISCFSRASKVVQQNKQELIAKQNVRLVTKEQNRIRRNIERQISDTLLNQQVAKLTVPEEYMGDFLSVIKEMDVGVQQIGPTEFLIVAKEGVVI
jgi:NAD(P)H-dependent flavin oxidoreductase YrpB (nitropropane dioxygenase family)